MGYNDSSRYILVSCQASSAILIKTIFDTGKHLKSGVSDANLLTTGEYLVEKE